MKVLNYLFLTLVSSFLIIGCAESEGKDAKVSEVKEAAVKPEAAETYTLNLATSKVLWEGTKSTGKVHHGTIDLKSGRLHVHNGKITSGNFIIDMTTITDLDLEEPYKGHLEAHLKGTADGKADDFFNTTKYPTAKFVITKVLPLNGDSTSNAMIYGNLTIKGITHNVGFRAQIGLTENTLKATTPKFKIDRTRWNVMYQSKSILKSLKDGFINDEIGITLQITAKKNLDS